MKTKNSSEDDEFKFEMPVVPIREERVRPVIPVFAVRGNSCLVRDAELNFVKKDEIPRTAWEAGLNVYHCVKLWKTNHGRQLYIKIENIENIEFSYTTHPELPPFKKSFLFKGDYVPLLDKTENVLQIGQLTIQFKCQTACFQVWCALWEAVFLRVDVYSNELKKKASVVEQFQLKDAPPDPDPDPEQADLPKAAVPAKITSRRTMTVVTR